MTCEDGPGFAGWYYKCRAPVLLWYLKDEKCEVAILIKGVWYGNTDGKCMRTEARCS